MYCRCNASDENEQKNILICIKCSYGKIMKRNKKTRFLRVYLAESTRLPVFTGRPSVLNFFVDNFFQSFLILCSF